MPSVREGIQISTMRLLSRESAYSSEAGEGVGLSVSKEVVASNEV
jgi:hypothetical protein